MQQSSSSDLAKPGRCFYFCSLMVQFRIFLSHLPLRITPQAILFPASPAGWERKSSGWLLITPLYYPNKVKNIGELYKMPHSVHILIVYNHFIYMKYSLSTAIIFLITVWIILHSSSISLQISENCTISLTPAFDKYSATI